MNIKIQISCLLISLSILLAQCENKVEVEQRLIFMNDLQKATLGNEGEYTNVKILKTYLSKNTGQLNSKIVNLYICKDVDSNDTIYVFDNSKDIPAFVKDTTIDIGVTIDKRNVKINSPMQAIVFVPKQFIMPKHAKYIYASLTGVGQ